MAPFKALRVTALFLCATIVAAAAQAASPPAVDPKVAALAKEWLLGNLTGHVDRSQLSPSAAKFLTPQLMRQGAKDMAQLGAFESLTYVDSDMTGQDKIYDFIAKFSKSSIYWVIGLDPHGKINGLYYAPVPPKMHLPQAQLLAALGEEMQREAKAGAFSGAVLIAKDGEQIFAQAYGLADREHHVPNTMATRFRIGSMNKMFTAVATLQLVQAGKIGLDDAIGKYLTDYPNKDLASTVTIRELLTHTGGTGDIFGPEFYTHRLELKTLDDYVKLFGSRAPKFKPGSRFDYSNYGFILLGVIIERVSAESYYDYVAQHVFEPAGMTSTGSEPEDVAVPDRSIGYTGEGSKSRPNTGTLPYRGTSAGGGYSTAGDLLKFSNALQANELVGAQYVRILTTGVTAMPSLPERSRKYAMGFGDETFNGQRCFGHDGGAPGMNGSLEICPSSGYTIVVLSNLDPPAADSVSDFVRDRLPLK